MIIRVLHTDITRLHADAIVNAANTMLQGGGGVDGAIHRTAGPELHDACKRILRELGPCPNGEVRLTQAGNLDAQYVIHAVGPIWHGGANNENQILASCYKKALELSEKYNMQSIAFPNISTGVFGFPKDKAVQIVHTTITEMLPTLKSLKEIIFCCFDEENYELYQKKFTSLLDTK